MEDFLNIPTQTVVSESEITFLSDYKYVDNDTIKNITIQHLGKLEADLHTLRILYISNGKNPDVMISQNRTLGQELERVSSTIEKLEEYFNPVLK